MFNPFNEFKRRLEIFRLNKAALNHVVPAPSELVGVNHNRVTWRIQVPGQADRFMSLHPGTVSDEFFVVHVDTEVFYRIWLSCNYDCVLREDMPKDYRYHWAVNGFSHGFENPVPLAYGRAWMGEDIAQIGFINGVTRTFWLIANRAPTFPIEVHSKRSADLLHSLAGVGSGPIPTSSISKDCLCSLCTITPDYQKSLI